MAPKAFKAARVLTDSQAELILDGAVVIDEDTGKITAVGPWSQVRSQLVDEGSVEDLGDVTLMPGLFDCHVHLVMDPHGGHSTNDIFRESDEAQLEMMSENALRLLDAGVTSARDLGCPGTYAVTIRDRIKSGQIMGPRMMVSNSPITVPGGHACAMGGEAAGVEDVRAMVRRNVANGADVIKVMTTGGFMTKGTHPSQARYTVEELAAMADEAHKAGIKITTHAQGCEGIRRAVEAGFDSIEHCSWSVEGGTKFDIDIARQIVAKDVAVCPTMNTACTHDHYFCPWDSRKMIIANLASLRKEGARLLVGTDAGIGLCRFERYSDGLFVLQDAGYTAREIIQGATDGAAAECGLEGVTGKLQPGLAADLAAFEGNPLDNIVSFTKPTFVLANGRRHKLTPIAPFGDQSERIAQIWDALRSGAGLAVNHEK